jgi:hypothetical protein
MAETDTLYISVNHLKSRLIDDITDDTDDRVIVSCIKAASRLIEDYLGTRFYLVSETRCVTPEFSDMLILPPFRAVSALATDDANDRAYRSVWTTADYEPEPANAALDDKPYTRLYVSPISTRAFPVGLQRGARVTATFGYAAKPPATVVEACAIEAAQLFKRKDAIFGASGPSSLGQLTVNIGGSSKITLDRDVKLLLDPILAELSQGVYGV